MPGGGGGRERLEGGGTAEGGEGHDGADGDVDAAGDDDEGEAHGHDGVVGHGGRDAIDEVVEVEKRIGETGAGVVVAVAGEDGAEDKDNEGETGLGGEGAAGGTGRRGGHGRGRKREAGSRAEFNGDEDRESRDKNGVFEGGGDQADGGGEVAVDPVGLIREADNVVVAAEVVELVEEPAGAGGVVALFEVDDDPDGGVDGFDGGEAAVEGLGELGEVIGVAVGPEEALADLVADLDPLGADAGGEDGLDDLVGVIVNGGEEFGAGKLGLGGG